MKDPLGPGRLSKFYMNRFLSQLILALSTQYQSKSRHMYALYMGGF